MATLLYRWTRPEAVGDHLHGIEMPDTRKAVWYPIRWGIPVAVLVACAAYFIQPMLAVVALIAVMGFAVMLSAWLWFLTLYPRPGNARYELTSAGIRIVTAGAYTFRRWQHFEQYRIYEFSEAPGIRVIELKSHLPYIPTTSRLFYDPKAVDEPALLSILDQHLPGKRRDGPAGPASS